MFDRAVLIGSEIVRCVDLRYAGPGCDIHRGPGLRSHELCTSEERHYVIQEEGTCHGKMAERSKALESGYLPIQSERARVRISFLSNRFDSFSFCAGHEMD